MKRMDVGKSVTDAKNKSQADSPDIKGIRPAKAGYVSRLQDLYAEVKRRFILGQLDEDFHRDSLLRLDKCLSQFEINLNDREKAANELLKTRAYRLLIDGLYWTGRIKEVRAQLGLLGEVVSETFQISGILRARDARGSSAPAAPQSELDVVKRLLLREKVGISVIYTLVMYYHKHDYGKAEDCLRKCLDVLQMIHADDSPCFASRALVSFYLGRIMRNLHKWKEAERFFRDAIDCHGLKVEFELSAAGQPGVAEEPGESLEDRLAFSRYRTALFLAFGRGWLNLQRGLLEIALYYDIIPARISLEETRDLVNKGYLRMLEGCVRRELIGIGGEAELVRAFNLIETARTDFFVPMKHVRYVELAEYEEAVTSLYLIRLWKREDRREKSQGRYREAALNVVANLERAARDRDDVRSLSQYLVLKSKLLRTKHENREAAMKVAEEAFECLKNNETRDRIYCIEALIAGGASLIDLTMYDGAIGRLQQALKLNRDEQNGNSPVNPRLEVIIHLLMARVHAKRSEVKEAKELFETASKLAKAVENAVVKELSAEVKREIEEVASAGFTIDPDCLDLKENVEKLRIHLTNRALAISKRNVTEAARLLGVNKSSVFRYRKARP